MVSMKRRTFLATPAITVAAAQGAGADDRIGVGVIGCGGMGRMDLIDFQRQAEVEIRAVCDVYRPNAETAAKLVNGKPDLYNDYRRVLDRKDIDAVIVATPDHWHPLITVQACDAGKDVYVEKPISHNVREGRLMVEAARRNNRVVQVGIQQRSGAHFQRAAAAVREGRIGKVHFAQCWNHGYSASNKGMGYPKDEPVPAGLDWDLWLGPAPKIAYNPARRNFRAFFDSAGGELTTWCVHLIDVVHFATGSDTPLTVSSSGGKWYFDDCRDCADTRRWWEYPGNMLVRYSTMVHQLWAQRTSGTRLRSLAPCCMAPKARCSSTGRAMRSSPNGAACREGLPGVARGVRRHKAAGCTTRRRRWPNGGHVDAASAARGTSSTA
jgi:predicted dehydrogenase